jgi:cardiolipin synthase A/B
VREGGTLSPEAPSAGPPAPLHDLIVEPDDGSTAVVAAIEGASSTIDLTIYELSDPGIVGALIAAPARKVQVRVIYDWYSFSPDDQQTQVLPTIQRLTNAGVACRPAPRTFEVTHEKALVIDGARALVLTFNLASEYFSTTRDFGISTLVPGEIAEIQAVFEADWNDRPITPAAPTLVWSPVNSRAKITALIQGARQTLDVYCEELEDPGTLGALVAAAKRGVTVRVIAAVLTSTGTGNDNAPGITLLRAGGVDAVSKSFPAPSGAGPLYIHAKAIVADLGSPTARAFVGSENLSCVSLDDNRECGLLVTESAILDRLDATFASDWGQPSVPVPADATPLKACPGQAAARARARVAARP